MVIKAALMGNLFKLATAVKVKLSAFHMIIIA